ncbi:hypothetical protein CJ212_04355 [Gardnerella vaginalis]|nr:hypothetical protein CJ212_04355 [Gardnerella vaginalis]
MFYASCSGFLFFVFCFLFFAFTLSCFCFFLPENVVQIGVSSYKVGKSLARYSALTSSLALKAHCAFNFEQAQRSELPSRATL